MQDHQQIQQHQSIFYSYPQFLNYFFIFIKINIKSSFLIINKSIRLLVEGFFDDETFNVGNDIKTDIEDLGKYYDYQVGDIIYQNKKPYAVCCGDNSQFKDNKPRFCLLNKSKLALSWSMNDEIVKDLQCYKFNPETLQYNNKLEMYNIDENGYENTQIIKNNHDINRFPAFKYCINLGDNVYLPAIDELSIIYLHKEKLKNIINFDIYDIWSSTQASANNAYCISMYGATSYQLNKYRNLCRVHPFMSNLTN